MSSMADYIAARERGETVGDDWRRSREAATEPQSDGDSTDITKIPIPLPFELRALTRDDKDELQSYWQQ